MPFPLRAADLNHLDQRVPCEVREAHRDDLLLSQLLRDFFPSALPGLGRALEMTTARALLERAQGPGFLRLFAEAGSSVACLLLEAKKWDTERLAVPTSFLTVFVTAPDRLARYRIASELLGHWLDSYPETAKGVVFSRLAVDDVPVMQALENRGFRLLVPMVTLGKSDLGKKVVELPPKVEVSPVTPGEIEDVSSIARSAFLWGRFSSDPWAPAETAGNVEAEWARNCCLGSQADHVLVARRVNDVLGFIALKFHVAGTVRVGSIELIATAESSRGLGVGRALVRAGCNWLAETTEHAVVRTELPNTPALRLYEAEGFRVLNGSVYMSRWQGA